jgi:hypothetical protein
MRNDFRHEKRLSSPHCVNHHRAIVRIDDRADFNLIARAVESDESVDNRFISDLGHRRRHAMPYRMLDVFTGYPMLERGSANSDVIER